MRLFVVLAFVLLTPFLVDAQRYISIEIRWEEGFIYIPYNGVKVKEGLRPVYRGQGNMKVAYFDRQGGEIGHHFVKTPQFLRTWDGDDEHEYDVREGTFTVYLPYNFDIAKLAIYDNASWEAKGNLIGDWMLSSRMKHLHSD